MDNQSYITQTLHPPLEDLSLVETHKGLLENVGIEWTDVGIMIDKDHYATLILLLENDALKSVLRFSLSHEHSHDAIALLLKAKGKIFLRSHQQDHFTIENLQDITSLEAKWNTIEGQDISLSLDEVHDFFYKIETGCLEKGRGKDFGAETKKKVMFASHGRCMFEGCGEDLGFDSLTGYEGNFAYLAHNISSSELSTRGVPVLSSKLSNDPQNVLLLCDKHHRLVDKVAKAEFPAERLAKMRKDFIAAVQQLLNGVAYAQIPAYAVLWPVHRNIISAPSPLQINQCLAVTKQRLKDQLQDLSDNEATLRDLEPAVIKQIMPDTINCTAAAIAPRYLHLALCPR